MVVSKQATSDLAVTQAHCGQLGWEGCSDKLPFAFCALSALVIYCPQSSGLVTLNPTSTVCLTSLFFRGMYQMLSAKIHNGTGYIYTIGQDFAKVEHYFLFYSLQVSWIPDAEWQALDVLLISILANFSTDIIPIS